MAEWHWSEGDTKHGPCSAGELKQLVKDGRILPATLIWKSGAPNWVPASTVKGLFSDSPPPLPPETPHASDTAVAANKTVEVARKHASTLINDLASLNFREEVVPIDEQSVKSLIGDFVFWCVTVLGVVPLLIGTLSRLDYQLTAFAIFFAILWGVIFKYFIVQSQTGWTGLIISLLATGIGGIYLLLTIYEHVLPESYLGLSGSENATVRLFGYIAQVGVCEELCKAAPVLVYLAWARKNADGMTAVLVGLFSGLGFAAFENVDYGQRSVITSYALTKQYGTEGLVVGVQQAMIVALLRSVSLVFCHAVWSGIFAYFLAVASLSGRRQGALAVVGLSVAAILHGVYDWLQGVQQTFAALVVVASFMLFYAYMSRLRLLTQPTTFDQGGQGDDAIETPVTSEVQ